MSVNQVLRFMNPTIFPKNILQQSISNTRELNIIFDINRNKINLQNSAGRHVFYKTGEKMKEFKDFPKQPIFQEWIYTHRGKNTQEIFIHLLHQKYLQNDELELWEIFITDYVYYQGLCEYEEIYMEQYKFISEMLNRVKHTLYVPNNIPKKYTYITK